MLHCTERMKKFEDNFEFYSNKLNPYALRRNQLYSGAGIFCVANPSLKVFARSDSLKYLDTDSNPANVFSRNYCK
jgi:hypothetical protein